HGLLERRVVGLFRFISERVDLIHPRRIVAADRAEVVADLYALARADIQIDCLSRAEKYVEILRHHDSPDYAAGLRRETIEVRVRSKMYLFLLDVGNGQVAGYHGRATEVHFGDGGVAAHRGHGSVPELLVNASDFVQNRRLAGKCRVVIGIAAGTDDAVALPFFIAAAGEEHRIALSELRGGRRLRPGEQVVALVVFIFADKPSAIQVRI